MNKIIDWVERQKALDPRKSLLIQAPAGSGKTELLIQRYLCLLGGVEYPGQIISMTFTRKAAEEMKRRILEALKRGLNQDPPKSKHQRQTWELAKLALKNDTDNCWRILDNPNQLKILTIDSFCASLIKQMPMLSWMGGPLDIIENATDLYQKASKRILAKVESNDKVGERVRIILKHLDNSKSAFLDRINQLFNKRDQWMIPFFDDFVINDDKRKYFENIFSKLIESTLIDLHSVVPNELQAIIPIASSAGKNCLIDNQQNPISSLNKLTTIPEHHISDLILWKGISELILTNDGNLRKTITKNIGFPPSQKKK
jgi:ATP-dependent exoDNAse (exonuclease V) beta subunit